MAGPHVAGVVALMWSANPSLIGDIQQTERILAETATPFRGTLPACTGDGSLPNNAVGYGVVNAYEAVRASIALR
jgi:subtilisin family serine protease